MLDRSCVSESEVKRRKEYLRSQIIGLKRYLGVEVTEIAMIAGYNRSSWRRAVNAGTVKVEALMRLEVHYDIPPTYWHPRDEEVIAPVTEKVMRTMRQLSAVNKHAVLSLARDLARGESAC